MKRPVFTFEAEILTNAPFDHVAKRLTGEGLGTFRCLRPLGPWAEPEACGADLKLRWQRQALGAEESGVITVRPDPMGAHLKLEGRLKGWGGFLRLGLVRWRTDRLLDRLVEEL